MTDPQCLLCFCFDFNAHPPYMPFQPALWLSLCLSLLACNASWVELWSKHQDKQKAMEKPQSKRLFTHQKKKEKGDWGVRMLTFFSTPLCPTSDQYLSTWTDKEECFFSLSTTTPVYTVQRVLVLDYMKNSLMFFLQMLWCLSCILTAHNTGFRKCWSDFSTCGKKKKVIFLLVKACFIINKYRITPGL